jgi:hypothetical protein
MYLLDLGSFILSILYITFLCTYFVLYVFLNAWNIPRILTCSYLASAVVKATGTRSLKLDTRNIKVHDVKLLASTKTSETPITFNMGKVHEAFGACLNIELPWEMRVIFINL